MNGHICQPSDNYWNQSVINWGNAYIAQLGEAPLPDGTPEIAEQDEIHSFIGEKKESLHHDDC
jgi:hypothetical protein